MLSKQLDAIISSLSPEDLEATLSTLRKIFDNIIQHPNDGKYRQIKLANKTFSSKVWRYPACEELMKISGWVVEDDLVRLRDDSHVHIVSQLLESRQRSVIQGRTSSSGNSVIKYLSNEYESLISTVVKGNISKAQHLLKTCNISTAGMVYCEDGSSVNLLHVAFLSQKIDIVNLLLKQYSVDPYVADDDGKVHIFGVFSITPQSFIINFLKICGVNMSFRLFKSGATLLHCATFASCNQVVCFLVEECGVDLNMCDNNLNAPLHTAYITGHTDIAEYLIQQGANVLAVNSDGHIPYDYIDGIPQTIALSRNMQNQRIIHKVPGSAEYMFYISLRNKGINYIKAATLTMEQFPSLTEDGPTEPHHDIDQTSFTKELTQYITKSSSISETLGHLKLEQRHFPFIF